MMTMILATAISLLSVHAIDLQQHYINNAFSDTVLTIRTDSRCHIINS